jgi:hydroxymethylpyrimidine/phosphomethylpyrimidine kinase
MTTGSPRPPVVLTIGGHDPTCGAGITLDTAVVRRSGGYPLAVATAQTVQDTRRVHHVVPTDPGLLAEQLAVVAADLSPDAIKIGMLGSLAVARVVAGFLAGQTCPVVLDPVLAATSGDQLVDDQRAVHLLLPFAALMTPNLHEIGTLAGVVADDEKNTIRGGRLLIESGCRAVLVTGGHRPGNPVDILIEPDGIKRFEERRIGATSVHGTGCALSSWLALELGRGCSVVEAVRRARGALRKLLQNAVALGSGQLLLNVTLPFAGSE